LEISARLSRKTGRKFAFTLGPALLAIGLVAWWRGHVSVPIGLGGAGTALIVAGALVPTRLGPVERAWGQLGHAISRIMTPITMGLLYFGAITPIGAIMRAIGRNPLEVRSGETNWVSRGEKTQSDLERQF
jgi:hypothetical protein